MKCRKCNGSGQEQVWEDRETNVWYYEACGSCGGRGKFVAISNKELAESRVLEEEFGVANG